MTNDDNGGNEACTCGKVHGKPGRVWVAVLRFVGAVMGRGWALLVGAAVLMLGGMWVELAVLDWPHEFSMLRFVVSNVSVALFLLVAALGYWANARAAFEVGWARGRHSAMVDADGFAKVAASEIQKRLNAPHN